MDSLKKNLLSTKLGKEKQLFFGHVMRQEKRTCDETRGMMEGSLAVEAQERFDGGNDTMTPFQSRPMYQKELGFLSSVLSSHMYI